MQLHFDSSKRNFLGLKEWCHPGGGEDLRMDGGLPPGFQKATLL